MEKRNKDRIVAILVTIAVHLMLLLALWFLVLRTPLPLPGEEGILVNLGYSDQGMGKVQKEQPIEKQKVIPPKPKATKPAASKAKEDIITQETEKAPSLKKVKKNKKKKPKKVEDKKKVEKENKKEEKTEKTKEKPKKVEPKKPKVNPKALYKGKKTSQESAGEGETNQEGDQGSSSGDKSSTNHTEGGGTGNGISYSLSGRKFKHLPKPEYKSNDQGKIVVTIYVNKYGKVVRAVPGAKGTTISDTRLHALTKKAALRAQFSANPEAPEVQKGTITYNFIRVN